MELVASGVLASEASVLMGVEQRQSTRPNFLFIIADDLAYRTIHTLNNEEIHTPNLDRLANKGCAFTHCFHQGSWQGAVCVPSRTMLNSGLSAFHAETGLDRVHTWGQTMGAAGYNTYICGKWHLDPTVLQRSFKEMGPVAPGFLAPGRDYYSDQMSDFDQDYSNSPLIDDPAYFRPKSGDQWNPADRSRGGHWLRGNLVDITRPDAIEHSSVIYADCVIRHLMNKAQHSNPFFIYLGFNAPHDPRQAPQEFLDLYSQDKIQIPPNFLPIHPFDILGPSTFGREEVLAPFPHTKEAVQLHRREYYAIISHMDHQVGRILDALEKTGMISNTYVILTADHGLAVGEHGLMGKQNMYECSIRVPLIIAGPGITAGRRVDELVYQHSMYATTCELAGVPVPKTVEFPSLVPLLHGSTAAPPHEAVFSYYRHTQRSIRTKQYKLIAYLNIHKIQLFDVETDPWEMQDLSSKSAMDDVKRELVQRLERVRAELGDPVRTRINPEWI